MLAKDYYAYLAEAKQKKNTLQHYGIAGQKWGIRRWQYEDGKFNEEGKIRYFGKKSGDSNGDGPKDYETGKINYEMDPVLAMYAITLGVYVAGAGVAVGASAIHDASISHKIKKYEKHKATEETDPKTGLKLKDPADTTTKEDMVDVNMEHRYWMFHGNDRVGRTENCMLCTTALDLKRRGYDVKAGKSTEGFNEDELKKWYKKPKIEKDNLGEIIKKLKNEPEGSYGNFMCIWKMGGGHSMFYRIENGKIAIYDAQSGKYYKDITKSDLYSMMWGGSNEYNGTCYVRTDNLEINTKYLKEKEYVE